MYIYIYIYIYEKYHELFEALNVLLSTVYYDFPSFVRLLSVVFHLIIMMIES